MPLGTILVDLSGDAGHEACVAIAARLAGTHASHLIGVAPTGGLDADFSWAASRSLQEASGARDAAALAASRRADRFHDLCRALHVASFESQAVEGDRAAVLLHRSHAADLTVIGQARQHREDRQFVDRMLLHNARPTLLVPEGAASTHLGERVLVAWDDSAACARAVTDALPVLAKAREVRLRIWRREGEAGSAAIAQRLDEVMQWLSRQGVMAEGRVELATRAIGDEILHAADALGCDLIVMGTYSHARWAERLLGGASQTALQRARVPLWMSH